MKPRLSLLVLLTLAICCLNMLCKSQDACAQNVDSCGNGDSDDQTVGDCRDDGSAQQTFDECGRGDTNCKEREIVEALFRLPYDKIFYKYNRYGKKTDLTKYGLKNYMGGHPGWDVQTKDKSKKRCFYSLTAGVVLLDGKDNKGKPLRNNTIAVYDSAKRMTTFYAHADIIHPSIKKGSKVEVGTPLGTQGDTGKATGVHVHLEVHVGKTTRTSNGTDDKRRKTINPVQYLYDRVRGARRK